MSISCPQCTKLIPNMSINCPKCTKLIPTMSISCPKCTKLIRKNQNSITFYYCENSVHLICENIFTELYNRILTEKNNIFWDCYHCRDESKELRNQNKELQVESLSFKTDNKSSKNNIYALEANSKHLKESL